MVIVSHHQLRLDPFPSSLLDRHEFSVEQSEQKQKKSTSLPSACTVSVNWLLEVNYSLFCVVCSHRQALGPDKGVAPAYTS